MSLKEATNYALEYFELITNWLLQMLALVAKFIPLTLCLGVVIAHAEQAILKKQPMSSILISIIGSFVVVYTLTPVINHYLEGSNFYAVGTLAIGYFIQYLIKFVTNQKRINDWLIMIEKICIEWIKNKFKKK